jgi:hypothetical protein
MANIPLISRSSSGPEVAVADGGEVAEVGDGLLEPVEGGRAAETGCRGSSSTLREPLRGGGLPAAKGERKGRLFARRERFWSRIGCLRKFHFQSPRGWRSATAA